MGHSALALVAVATVLCVFPKPVLADDYNCDVTNNFISGMTYTQHSLTSYCSADGVCDANPIYGSPNSVEGAVAYCKGVCSNQALCTGFFFQKHNNGHEVCGFYMGPLDHGEMTWHGHQSGSQICEKGSSAPAPTPETATGGSLAGSDLYNCDTAYNFVHSISYSQISLTDYCSNSVCDANPVYGSPNSVEKALAYCQGICTENNEACTGFFFQKHTNGHEICGFYSDDLSGGVKAAHGHADGSQLCEKLPACPANPATKVFLHYMLWFDGPDAGVNTGPNVGGHWGQAWYTDTGFDFSAYPDGDGCNNYDSLPTYNPPIGGQFSTYDPVRVKEDMELMVKYCIDGVILDYQQPKSYPYVPEEKRVIDRSLPVVIEAIEAAGLKFAIMYDTSSQDNWGWMEDDWSMQTSTAKVQENWAFVFETAANSPNYLKDDEGNSVFLGFGPTPMPDASTAALCPNCVFYAQYGDARVFNEIGTWPNLPFDQGYFTWGNGDESEQTNYDKHAAIYESKCMLAPNNYAKAPTPCIGSAIAGFYAIYKEHGQMRHDPVRLRDTLDLCREKGISWCQVMTWNDFNEGTQIAPSEWCDESGQPTNNPNQFLDVIKAFKMEE